MTSCTRTHPELTGWIIYILPKKPERVCPLWKQKGNKCKLITFHKPRLESDIGVTGKGTHFLMFTNLHRLGVIEWHFPLMCLCCFGTQLANWPLLGKLPAEQRQLLWRGASSGTGPQAPAALHCIYLCSVKAIIVWETYWGSGEASAGPRFGNGPISMELIKMEPWVTGKEINA